MNLHNRFLFNVNTFLKSVSTSKSRVTYDLNTDRVTYDLDTTMHKSIGVVGSPPTSLRLYLLPFRNLIFHCSWKRIHVNRLCPDTDTRVFSYPNYIFVTKCLSTMNMQQQHACNIEHHMTVGINQNILSQKSYNSNKFIWSCCFVASYLSSLLEYLSSLLSLSSRQKLRICHSC